MTSDHMLTTEQLAEIRNDAEFTLASGNAWPSEKTHSQTVMSLLRHVEALQEAAIDAAESQALKKIKQRDRAEAAEKRAERLAEALRDTIDGLNEILMYRETPTEVEAFAKDYINLARQAIEGDSPDGA